MAKILIKRTFEEVRTVKNFVCALHTVCKYYWTSSCELVKYFAKSGDDDATLLKHL